MIDFIPRIIVGDEFEQSQSQDNRFMTVSPLANQIDLTTATEKFLHTYFITVVFLTANFEKKFVRKFLHEIFVLRNVRRKRYIQSSKLSVIYGENLWIRKFIP